LYERNAGGTGETKTAHIVRSQNEKSNGLKSGDLGGQRNGFHGLTFRDSDYDTKTPKTCTDQIRNKKYKKGEGAMVHTAVQVWVSNLN